MADAGHDPLPQVTKSLQISKKYKNVEILWASTENHTILFRQEK